MVYVKKRKRKKQEPTPETAMRVRTPREGQVLGEVEQLLGDRRMMVRCADKHARVCRIPGKIRRRIWIKEGDIVLVEPWTVQTNEKGDILWRYSHHQANWLERKGFLEGIEEV
ncbi:MAG: translation initiation factor eIF-1A [Candidatus Altiarchaeales archaeon]|nr:translation initiation factor eIF-1A [Candidatus Altiarchaeota archaeon]MBU4266295.1 translation initiation factor eIF-1A [Candidatus Altiarchaeota archaeon]MBU4341270.1 translation initiation factor eIF-1A [Candidatus Altiarchaeota archaeon]MBU4437902.1 translation initiation factor eIF-1A [Candidatus Altiarchaeota archaeon]MCG2782817.1 translation initiation factor eIF-1A [Candidatus Altiarchaeales archaeon]